MTDEPVETVLLDLDGTLCRYRRTGEELLAVAFDAVGVEPLFTAADYRERLDAFLEADGEASFDEVRARCFADLAAERGRDPELGRAVADVYADEREQSEVEWMPGAREAVDALSAYRLGVVTNGPPEIQTAKLEALGLPERVATVVFAGHDTPPKPEPDPFHAALDALDGTPGRAVHVGDSPRADVGGARAAGLRAAWIREDGIDPDPAPDYVLGGPGELVEEPWV
ncbi:MAG: HAD family hydrolase [Haloarculaceae archaeon]